MNKAALILILLVPGLSYGETKYEKVCDPKKEKQCVQPLLVGETAPFSGQLLTTEKALALGQESSFCEERISVEVRREKSEADVQLSLEKRLRGLEMRQCNMKTEILKKHLTKALESQQLKIPWYKEPFFVAAVSVITIVVIQSVGNAN